MRFSFFSVIFSCILGYFDILQPIVSKTNPEVAPDITDLNEHTDEKDPYFSFIIMDGVHVLPGGCSGLDNGR